MTVVLLHSIGLDSRSWQFLSSSELADAVRYDLLWHGGRAEPDDALTLRAMAADVVDSVPGRLDVVGVSMGGYVARQLALHWPNRVRSLLTAGASAGDGVGGGPLRDRAELTERVGMTGVVHSTLQRWFTDKALTADTPAVAYARSQLVNAHPNAFAASWRALASDDSLPRLHQLNIPTTVVHATDDASVPMVASERVAHQIPGSRLVLVPGPHMMHLERPQEFEAAVHEHLRWVASQESESGAIDSVTTVDPI
ncbi:alpha/beta fold hydrolase [Subtercola sp. YIM 133946]|uniref:alpha/beta fold hydrolase n=1 Tax=Subtercola sp. YIM 133946 TaxID=3118909 RepID=UPI002F9322C3